MSVICQNFVQNAWKKDLCSNCFKSVGDHDFGEHGISEQTKPNPPKQLKIAYVPQSAGVGAAQNSNPTPHTTWKSLISEKNSKNSQPFKLETGFQGRLLTINKATTNGAERNCIKNGVSRNGHASDSELLSEEPRKPLNGQTAGFSNPKTRQFVSNGNSLKNGINRNGEISENGFKPSKEFEYRSHATDAFSPKQVLTKSKSEDSLSAPLHSILKKTISTPSHHNRRGSNVGFKDEEPLVIGYGGRDFTPEELEWDMNTSDGEHTSDSLDETEDDKAFSKMTKQNTEFNSDNTNLLKQGAILKTSNTEVATACRTTEIKNNNKPDPREKNSINGTLTDIKQNGKLHKTGDVSANTASTEAADTGAVQIKSNMINLSKVECKRQSDKKSEPPSADCFKSLDNGDVDWDGEKTGCPLGIQGSVATAREDATSVVTLGAVTTVEAAAKTVGTSGDRFKNSSRVERESLSPSPRDIPAQNGRGMFEHRPEDTLLPEEAGNNAWQENDSVAGEILQAINTSLTNRHKMNESRAPAENYDNFAADTDSSPLPEPSRDNQRTLEVRENAINNELDGPTVSEDDSEPNFEPRKSFLHGLTSQSPKPATAPSAIYGPASDLFVARSNSSSSSSSDELTKKDDVNVIVNSDINSHKLNVTESENDDIQSHHSLLSETESNCSVTIKSKPKIPAKPLKQPARPPACKIYARSKSSEPAAETKNSDFPNGSHYSVSNAIARSEGPKPITLVDHYAEGNIYQEVVDDQGDSDQSDKGLPRETKLAALAMELEQARCCNGNTKRQAPAPPKIPEPPSEEPPNSIGRTSPSMSDSSHGFSSFRGEVVGFSSSSSTASTSSQDTETGYASWNLNGDMDAEHRKHSKSSKSSFLLTQYSKCKMLAKEYAEDSARTRKRFSLKKLLKIKKDGDPSSAFDPNCPNPKAWKYSDQFERPRAKLEIIHPMDLENKSVTVNPGFDSLHLGSVSSFSASADDLSLRNSVSSDYGSFYSDTITPGYDSKHGKDCERLPPPLPPPPDDQEEQEDKSIHCGSNSPTPSRSSSLSQASTLTSGSSKNGGASPHRPPKPPPPPRAHSLLPGNKALNPDGTMKFPVVNCNSDEGADPPVSPTKPQAPKRQMRPSLQRTDCGIYDNTSPFQTSEERELYSEHVPVGNTISVEENAYGTILDIRSCNSNETAENRLSEPASSPSSPSSTGTDKYSFSMLESKCEIQSINVTVKSNITEPGNKVTSTAIGRGKNGPVTKAPARPPPIYMKSQIINAVKNPNPWKTLEDSYVALTASNREMLLKLVNQALKKRRNFLSTVQKLKFQWSEFEIDVEQSSPVFAFGEKIAYHATMPKHPEYSLTLVVTVQQQPNRLNDSSESRYPVLGQFVDSIPRELLDNSTESAEFDSMQATVLVLHRCSSVSTVESFSESMPDPLPEESEKELCFIALQLIHNLKSLQAQGTEALDPGFHNLVLARTGRDRYHSLVFLSDGCYDEGDYLSDCGGDDECRVSLCQCALLLLYRMLGVNSAEEFEQLAPSRFSTPGSRRVFQVAIALLSEEKAVSLSQTKTLFECFLWDATRVLGGLEDSDDVDGVLQRWLDLKRASYIKSVMDDADGGSGIDAVSEYFSQFLLRSSIRNIKEVLSFL